MVGETDREDFVNRTILDLIRKIKYFLKPIYKNIWADLQNKFHDYKIAILTIPTRLDKQK